MPLCCFLKRTGVAASSGSVSPSCLPCARVSSREKASGSINMECAASGTGLSRSMVQLDRVPPFNFRSVAYTSVSPITSHFLTSYHIYRDTGTISAAQSGPSGCCLLHFRFSSTAYILPLLVGLLPPVGLKAILYGLPEASL